MQSTFRVVGLAITCVALMLAEDGFGAEQRYDSIRVAQGGLLAAVGNCDGCHSCENAPSYAGGVPLRTPFGTVYSSNLTPDVQTGIGSWSESDFVRAMRKGVAPDGRYLYPAFPYDHFTNTTDEELASLFSYLLAQEAVGRQPTPNSLNFPWNIRPLLAVWDLLFLKSGPKSRGPVVSAPFDRGAYLVESLGHCGSCHTPRNALGAEDSAEALNGARLDGWYAPALNSRSPSPVPWSVEQLSDYLKTGLAPNHAMAAGPMQSVIANLRYASDEDIKAIAVYLTTLMGASGPERPDRASVAFDRASRLAMAVSPPQQDALAALGATVYSSSCGSCHDRGRLASSGSGLQLPLAIALYDPDPRSFLRIVMEGITPMQSESGRWMPAFAGLLTAAQLKSLAIYLRQNIAEAAEWGDLDQAIDEVWQAREDPT